MALPVLDGNQSATTLSSVVTGGEHIVAHTVVSLGSTAISNITSAVSGSVVSISNFPSTQTIAGTVTIGGLTSNFTDAFWGESGGQAGGYVINTGFIDEGFAQSVTTANGLPVNVVSGPIRIFPSSPAPNNNAVRVILGYEDGAEWKENTYNKPIPVRLIQEYGFPTSVTATLASSVTIGSLPTLTPQLPRVTFIDGSGSVTTANTAITVFASSSTRSYLLVQVTTGSAFVNVGATATTLNGISLTAGQGYAWETTIPQGAVSLISTTTNSAYVAKQA